MEYMFFSAWLLLLSAFLRISMLSCVSVASRSLLLCPFVWLSPILFIRSPAQGYLAVPRFWLLWIKLSWASFSKSCVWVFLLKALGHGDVCLKKNCQPDFQSGCTLYSPSGGIWESGYPTSSPTLGVVRLFSLLVGVKCCLWDLFAFSW